jgi:hypothetical protein
MSYSFVITSQSEDFLRRKSMQRIGSALFLFIPAILLIFMFPQKISAGRSCSLTVHSYVSQCGDENDGTYADGQNVPDDASPLSGADYSLWKVGDVTTQNLDGTVTICACHINDEFLKLLIPGGLSPDIGGGEQEPFYQLADIQDAMTLPENSTDPGWMHEKSSKMAALEAEVTDLYDEWMELQ